MSPRTRNRLKRHYKRDIRRIANVISDCDPSYILDQLKKYPDHQHHHNHNNHQQTGANSAAGSNRVELVVTHLLENKNYPRLKDFLLRQRKQVDLENHLNMQLNIEEFLKLYPNPAEHFNRLPIATVTTSAASATVTTASPEPSKNYKRHCQVYLYKLFPYFATDSIENVLKKHSYRLTPAYKQLSSAYDEQVIRARIQKHFGYMPRPSTAAQPINYQVRKTIQKLKMTRNYVQYKLEYEPRDPLNYDYPSELDEQFFKELVFIKNEHQILSRFK